MGLLSVDSFLLWTKDLLQSNGSPEGRGEHQTMAELGEMTLVCKETCFWR